MISLGFLGLGFYLFPIYIFTIAVIIAVIAMAILRIFKSSLFHRLSTRIAVLILASGPITLILIPVSNDLLTRGPRVSPLGALVVYVLIALGTPIGLGLLAALFLRRPLRQLKEVIASLQQSNYKVQLQSMGIYEFDEVFAKFNTLIHRLRHEEKLRKDLIADTSHELNTPLTTMIGQLTAIQEGRYPVTQERVALLKGQAERLADLVQQLDAYTKARMPVTDEPEDIHVRQFCEEFMKHFSLELKQKGITAQLHIAEDYTIHAHRAALQQILTNLMQNTLRYSQATEVTIEATAHQLLFSDNGKGVPPECLPYLFERFYRVDTSRSRATGGLGLGLAIVREVAESRGWAITAVAGHPGLTFVLTIKSAPCLSPAMLYLETVPMYAYIHEQLAGRDDPRWREFGAQDMEEYAFWCNRSCAIACCKMCIDILVRPQHPPAMMELIRQGLAAGGYILHNEAGEFVDFGWIYQPLVNVGASYGLKGEVYKTLSIEQICALLLRGALVMASVSIELGERDEIPITQKGGSIVLVHGFQWANQQCQSLLLYNPSGRFPDLRENAVIAYDRFASAFAGRGFAFWVTDLPPQS